MSNLYENSYILYLLKIQSKNKKIIEEQTWDSQAPVGYNHFQIGCVFAEYDLFKPTNYFYTKFHIYRFSYNFDRVLSQFLETGTSDRCLICIV